MQTNRAHYPAAPCHRVVLTSATASRTRQKLPAVRRSLAGLPVHQTAGGQLVVPVLQPKADNIPFGLALSLQSRFCASVCEASVEDGQRDLYELQYVLEGTGQASAGFCQQLQEQAVLSCPSERCSWQLLQLRAKSGALQNVAAGDSILAPAGRAWCQLADEVTLDSNLAVLKLLVPGKFPLKTDSQQGLIDDASKVLNAWHSSPVIGNLSLGTVMSLLAGAKKQAVLAVDSWQDKQTSMGIITTNAHELMPSTASEALQTVSSVQPSVSGKLVDTNQNSFSARLPQQAHQLLKGLVTAGQQMMYSVKKGPLVKLLFPDQCVVRKTLAELSAFQLPNQTNRLALMFDPMDHEVPFTFGLEIFEKGHKTNPHTHAVSHELFFILAGDGVGFCDNESFPVTAGDVVVFPPTSVHGIDNGLKSKMYCLELMLPNDMFAEFVRQGQPAGKLRDDDMCIMIAQGCASI